MILLSAFVLAIIISIDTLPAGFGYGASKIKVPLPHVIVLDIIGSILVGIALVFGFYIGRYIPASVTSGLSAGILIFMGCCKIFQYFRQTVQKETSRKIGWAETIILAIMLSFDGMAVGIGASIHNATIIFCISVIGFSLLTDPLFFILGHKIGQKATQKIPLDLAWLSGVVLTVLGIFKLL